jgi:YggT family protein
VVAAREPAWLALLLRRGIDALTALDALRFLAFGVFMATGAVAVGSWAVRTRRISPFGKSARYIRRVTDPVLDPVERWLLQRGGNPQNAEWWLLGGAVIGGILIITIGQWLIAQLRFVSGAGSSGPGALIKLAIYYAGQLVSIALLVRVIASWIRLSASSRFMRFIYLLTDWIVKPLRRVMPPLGMIDITPFVAWFIVRLLVSGLLGLF